MGHEKGKGHYRGQVATLTTTLPFLTAAWSHTVGTRSLEGNHHTRGRGTAVRQRTGKPSPATPRTLPGASAALLSSALRLGPGWVGKAPRGGAQRNIFQFIRPLPRDEALGEAGGGAGGGLGKTAPGGGVSRLQAGL